MVHCDYQVEFMSQVTEVLGQNRLFQGGGGTILLLN